LFKASKSSCASWDVGTRSGSLSGLMTNDDDDEMCMPAPKKAGRYFFAGTLARPGMLLAHIFCS
jgi:hypothetical protein